MVAAILLFFLFTIGIGYFAIYPYRRINTIKQHLVLKVNGAETHYSNLLLGDLGIFYTVNERDRVQVIFPRLTPEGDIQYIYSWHDLRSVRIPKSSGIDRKDLLEVEGLANLINEHIRFVEPEVLRLQNHWQEVNELLIVVATSDLYAHQKEIYERAMIQIENLLDKVEELEQVHIHFIREALISKKIGRYNPSLISDNSLVIDAKYQTIKEEYKYMKDVATAYAELCNTHKL